jgi:hypothetical protein
MIVNHILPNSINFSHFEQGWALWNWNSYPNLSHSISCIYISISKSNTILIAFLLNRSPFLILLKNQIGFLSKGLPGLWVSFISLRLITYRINRRKIASLVPELGIDRVFLILHFFTWIFELRIVKVPLISRIIHFLFLFLLRNLLRNPPRFDSVKKYYVMNRGPWRSRVRYSPSESLFQLFLIYKLKQKSIFNWVINKLQLLSEILMDLKNILF